MTSSGRSRKVLLIGFDSAVPGRWRRYAEQGDLPVGRRLLAEGAFATACLPAFPTLTTTNWATIATGAWPGTHGITDFHPHRPGDEIGGSLQGFDARDVTAEFVWEAAVRAGMDSSVVNWPGAWPPRPAPVARPSRPAPGGPSSGGLTIVGGAGIELNEWRIGLPGMERRVAVAAEQRFSTRPEPGAALVTLPSSGEPFELPLALAGAYDEVLSPVTLVCTVVRRKGRDVLRVGLAGAEEALAEVAAGDWSERLVLSLAVGGGAVEALFRLRLQDLDQHAGLLRLYVTDVCRQAWLEEPPGVLEGGCFTGLPTPGVGWDSLGAGCIDLETFVDLTGMATRWLADVCAHVERTRPCDLFCAHFHAIDSFYHLCSRHLDPATASTADVRRYEAAERAVYRQLDDALGAVIEAAGEPVLTVLVSDHGAKPGGAPVPVQAILARAGLLTLRERSSGRPVVDWSRTLAAPQGSCFVRVNLSGRDPRGIVHPGARGEVRRRAMEALLEYRDEATGRSPFTLVARAEDAASLGLYGDGVGDIVYAVDEAFADEHGQVLPQAMRDEGAWGMRSLCLFSGPGIRPRVVEEQISLTDIAPTVCGALGIGSPLHADGRVLESLVAGSGATDAPS